MATQSIDTPENAGPMSSQPASGWLATGGLLGAILASSCCIVPLLFVTLGVGGSWISQLTALEPYKPVFVAVTLGFLGVAFWHVYFKPRKACEPDSFCAIPTSSRLTKTVLWTATGLVLLAVTVEYWAPLFY